MFSDGFVDQFGGQNGSKYLKRNFKNFIISIQDTPIAQQRNLIKAEYHRWTAEKFEQLDDILVMGIEI